MSKNLDTLAHAIASGRARVDAPKAPKRKAAKRTPKKLPRKAKKSASRWREGGTAHARYWAKPVGRGFVASVHTPSAGAGFLWVLEDPEGRDIASGREPTRKAAERAALAEWKERRRR